MKQFIPDLINFSSDLRILRVMALLIVFFIYFVGGNLVENDIKGLERNILTPPNSQILFLK
jgi:hypothetical protein